jgi:hypothetical protein
MLKAGADRGGFSFAECKHPRWMAGHCGVGKTKRPKRCGFSSRGPGDTALSRTVRTCVEPAGGSS